MRKLTARLLWIVAFAIPWENLVIFEELGSLVRLLGLAAAGAGVVAVLLDGKLRRLSPVIWLAALFVLWSFTTVFWSIEADSTVDRSLTYIQLLGLMWLMWEFGAEPGGRSALIQAYVLGAYVSLIGALLGFSASAATEAKRYTAGTFNVNDLGLIFALGIPMAWYLVITQRSRVMKWINAAYVPTAAVGVLLTASRGAFVATVIASSMVLGSMARLPLRTKLLGLLTAATALFAAASVVPQSSWRRLSEGEQSVRSWNLTGRTAIWERGLSHLRPYILTGMGAAAFPSTTQAETGKAWVAHNTYLGLLIDEGIVGLSLFLLLVGSLVRSVRHLAPLERRLCLVLALTWGVGVLALSWEHRKPTWFVLGLLAAHVSVVRGAGSTRRPTLPRLWRTSCVPSRW